MLPLVVFDVTSKVENNPDYQITMDDVSAWESRNGLVPTQAFAIMRTGWGSRWPNSDLMRNAGVSLY